MSKINMFFQFLSNQIKGYKSNRGDSRRFKNYYMNNKEDTRGDVAKVLDFVVSRIAVFFVVFIIIFLKSQKLFLALTITTLAVIIYHHQAIKSRNKKLESLRKQKRWALASQKVYQEMINSTVEEMIPYIMSVFEKSGFNNLKSQWNTQNVIILEGEYTEERVMISTFIYKNEYFVELKELKEHLSQLKSLGYKKGILVTTSDFTADAYQYLEDLEDNEKILLLNRDLLMNMIEKVDMFPTEEEIDELVENRISRREKIWHKYKKSMLANNKVKSYFMLTLFLIFTSSYTPFRTYYLIVATITFSLGIMILVIRNLNKKNHEEVEWEALNKKLSEF